jgi:hypothetical protein
MLTGMERRSNAESMAHAKHAAQARLAEQAWSASRRMIARGERPGYRIAETGDGDTIHVIELPWLGRLATDQRNAIARARASIAAWLGVDGSTFDVERD